MNQGLVEFAVPPVRKVVLFKGGTEAAFDRFFNDIGRWWPLATHSMSRDASARVAFEQPASGGRLIETAQDGKEHVWGSIVLCERPRRLSFTWHVGRREDTAQLIELTFTPDGEATKVELTHSGWEHLGDEARKARDGYENGWDYVLGRFVAS